MQIWQNVSQNSEPRVSLKLWSQAQLTKHRRTVGTVGCCGSPTKNVFPRDCKVNSASGSSEVRFHHFRVLFFSGCLSWRVLLEWLGVQPVKLAWRLDRYWTGVGYKNGEFNKELPKLLQCTENAALEQKSGLDFAEVMWREKNYHRDLYNFHYISLIKILSKSKFMMKQVSLRQWAPGDLDSFIFFKNKN